LEVKIDLLKTGIGWQLLRRAADKSDNLKEAANVESRPLLMKPLPCKRLYTARACDQRSWGVLVHFAALGPQARARTCDL